MQTAQSSSQESYLQKASADKDGRFHNHWQQEHRHSFFGLIKWMFLSKNPYADEKKKPLNFKIEKPDFNKLGDSYIVWLGHSTVLMKVGGKVIITDPIFWDLQLFSRRKTPLPINPDELPHIDYVLISHSHYDHLDTRSLKHLKDTRDPVFIAGPGYKDFFSSIGITKYTPLNWTEELKDGRLKFTSLPVQHWSKRTPFDTDRLLWCSFLIEDGAKKYYWAGDSGYYGGFREIGERLGPIDIVMMPAGAYEPRWFMKGNHMNPEEALMAARDLKAKLMIPIHWGTFDLTDEPLWLPIDHLKEIYDKKQGPELKILNHGGSFIP